MKRIEGCNISVMESGKLPWQCGLPANHYGRCVPAPGNLTASPNYLVQSPDPEKNSFEGIRCECDGDFRMIYVWLMIITVAMAIFATVTLYSAVVSYQMSQVQ